MRKMRDAHSRPLDLRPGLPAFLLGFLAASFQIYLLREFSAVFTGNELTFGLFLGSWLLWGGLGSLVQAAAARRSLGGQIGRHLRPGRRPLLRRPRRSEVFPSAHGHSAGRADRSRACARLRAVPELSFELPPGTRFRPQRRTPRRRCRLGLPLRIGRGGGRGALRPFRPHPQAVAMAGRGDRRRRSRGPRSRRDEARPGQAAGPAGSRSCGPSGRIRLGLPTGRVAAPGPRRDGRHALRQAPGDPERGADHPLRQRPGRLHPS
ncbi:MAG: hypothetical protein M0C28_38535 [Candidatus Moduliflexus flocculans]|nr:hypothetical protein [Candidatus Moduliflexus flocculans]